LTEKITKALEQSSNCVPWRSGLVPLFLDLGLDKVVPVNSPGIAQPVPLELPADRGVVAAQSTGYFPERKLGDLQMTDDVSLLRCKMSVGHDGFLSGCWLFALSTLPETPSCLVSHSATREKLLNNSDS